MREEFTSLASQEYFEWLVSLVGEEWYGHRYRELLYLMFQKDYFWTVAQDENRAEDGKALRIRFLEDFPNHLWSEDLLDGHCASVLEVLIAFAERCSDQVFRDGMEKTVPIFWFFVENLGLTGCFDTVFTEQKRTKMCTALENWMGGATVGRKRVLKVPLFGNLCDANEELWYQMHRFLRENPLFW